MFSPKIRNPEAMLTSEPLLKNLQILIIDCICQLPSEGASKPYLYRMSVEEKRQKASQALSSVEHGYWCELVVQ